MKSMAGALALVLVATICLAQEVAPPQRTISWDQDTIARFRDQFLSQLRSLADFAGRPCPAGDTPVDRRTQKLRGTALRVLSSMQPAANATEIAKNNLSLYRQYPAFEGRYELTDWPAADALVQMGSLAYPAIYSRLGDPCSELDIALIVHIVLNVDGRELGAHRMKIKLREYGSPDERPFTRTF